MNNPSYPAYMIGRNANNKVALTFLDGCRPSASLFMTSNSVAFLIEELALQIRNEFLIDITELREDE